MSFFHINLSLFWIHFDFFWSQSTFSLPFKTYNFWFRSTKYKVTPKCRDNFQGFLFSKPSQLWLQSASRQKPTLRKQKGIIFSLGSSSTNYPWWRYQLRNVGLFRVKHKANSPYYPVVIHPWQKKNQGSLWNTWKDSVSSVSLSHTQLYCFALWFLWHCYFRHLAWQFCSPNFSYRIEAFQFFLSSYDRDNCRNSSPRIPSFSRWDYFRTECDFCNLHTRTRINEHPYRWRISDDSECDKVFECEDNWWLHWGSWSVLHYTLTRIWWMAIQTTLSQLFIESSLYFKSRLGALSYFLILLYYT